MLLGAFLQEGQNGDVDLRALTSPQVTTLRMKEGDADGRRKYVHLQGGGLFSVVSLVSKLNAFSTTLQTLSASFNSSDAKIVHNFFVRVLYISLFDKMCGSVFPVTICNILSYD